eukprot:sb/3465936/
MSTNEILTLALHNTIQCELLERNNTILEHSDCARKYCTGRLVSALAVHSTQNGPIATSTNIVQQLLDLISPEEQPSGSDEIPLVLQEPSWLLLKVVLFSKVATTWESYVTVVRMLLTLQTVRSFISVASLFSRDEQDSWSQRSGDTDFEALLALICRSLYWANAHTDHKEMDITGYVWSNHSIEAKIQELTLPLLREAAILGHHMFSRNLPRTSGPCELTTICQWFGFTPSSTSTRQGPSTSSSSGGSTITVIESLRLPTDKLLAIALRLNSQVPTPPATPRKPLLPLVKSWARPRLLNLPRIYGKLYFHYRHVKCHVCKSRMDFLKAELARKKALLEEREKKLAGGKTYVKRSDIEDYERER